MPYPLPRFKKNPLLRELFLCHARPYDEPTTDHRRPCAHGPFSLVHAVELLTIKEAAQYLRLSVGAIYALCAAAKLPHYRLSRGRGTLRIDRRDLLAYVRQCRDSGNEGAGLTKPRFIAKFAGFKHLQPERFAWPGVRPAADGPSSDSSDRSGG
jgi:excisionase family DNA binding protein